MTALLVVDGLDAFYGDFQALFDVSFDMRDGEVLALVGANGAGKSTTLRCLTGLLPVRAGRITLGGRVLSGLPAHQIARAGVALSPEGRRLFASLSVEENLRLGMTSGRKGPWTLQSVQDLFPVLREKRHQPATQLSGGQQQMVAVGRALMANPALLLLDELSLGLAPVIVRDIYACLPAIRANGTALIVVEQDIGRAMAVSDRLICLQEGHVNLEGASDRLTRDQIAAAYFGRTREAG